MTQELIYFDMSVRSRLEAAMDDDKGSIDPNGSRTVEVEIRSSGLSKDEVEADEAVEDVFDEGETYVVQVSADNGVYFAST